MSKENLNFRKRQRGQDLLELPMVMHTVHGLISSSSSTLVDNSRIARAKFMIFQAKKAKISSKIFAAARR